MKEDASRGELELSVRCWEERVDAVKWFVEQGGSMSARRRMLNAGNAEQEAKEQTKAKAKSLRKSAGKKVNAANVVSSLRVLWFSYLRRCMNLLCLITRTELIPNQNTIRFIQLRLVYRNYDERVHFGERTKSWKQNLE